MKKLLLLCSLLLSAVSISTPAFAVGSVAGSVIGSIQGSALGSVLATAGASALIEGSFVAGQGLVVASVQVAGDITRVTLKASEATLAVFDEVIAQTVNAAEKASLVARRIAVASGEVVVEISTATLRASEATGRASIVVAGKVLEVVENGLYTASNAAGAASVVIGYSIMSGEVLVAVVLTEFGKSMYRSSAR